LTFFTEAAELSDRHGPRYNMAVRLFQLDRWSDAIPIFQQARNDRNIEPTPRLHGPIIPGRRIRRRGGRYASGFD